jgi:hypothetical protein
MFKRKQILALTLVAMLLVVAVCGAFCATMISQNNHSCCPSSQSSAGGMDHSADHKISGPALKIEAGRFEQMDRIAIPQAVLPTEIRSLSTERVTVYSPPTQLYAQIQVFDHQFKGSKDFI